MPEARNRTPPPLPRIAEEARAWLAWARSSSHQAGCMCHGCLRARELLAGKLLDAPAAGSAEPADEEP